MITRRQSQNKRMQATPLALVRRGIMGSPTGLPDLKR